ncbi:hypothetical protein NMY22_g19909 [Coprinellus aureogranulatus]|nr:hypothetical protein NMY22_g19909 [Coprinellus aureogranulatus]
MAFKSISTFVMLATVIASASLSSAIPITLLDFESEAFDLDARAGALSCYPVDVKQIKALPAWKKIEKYAEDNWGKGGVNIVTNPDDVGLPGTFSDLRPSANTRFSIRIELCKLV